MKRKKSKNLFKNIVQLLHKIQKIKKIDVKDFKNQKYKIPIYSKKLLFDETKLFCDWYVPDILKKKNISHFNKKIKKK